MRATSQIAGLMAVLSALPGGNGADCAALSRPDFEQALGECWDSPGLWFRRPDAMPHPRDLVENEEMVGKAMKIGLGDRLGEIVRMP